MSFPKHLTCFLKMGRFSLKIPATFPKNSDFFLNNYVKKEGGLGVGGRLPKAGWGGGKLATHLRMDPTS